MFCELRFGNGLVLHDRSVLRCNAPLKLIALVLERPDLWPVLFIFIFTSRRGEQNATLSPFAAMTGMPQAVPTVAARF